MVGFGLFFIGKNPQNVSVCVKENNKDILVDWKPSSQCPDNHISQDSYSNLCVSNALNVLLWFEQHHGV